MFFIFLFSIYSKWYLKKCLLMTHKILIDFLKLSENFEKIQNRVSTKLKIDFYWHFGRGVNPWQAKSFLDNRRPRSNLAPCRLPIGNCSPISGVVPWFSAVHQSICRYAWWLPWIVGMPNRSSWQSALGSREGRSRNFRFQCFATWWVQVRFESRWNYQNLG